MDRRLKMPGYLSVDDLIRFRTSPCRHVRDSGTCSRPESECEYSHNFYWIRRVPVYKSDRNALRYLPLPCPDIVLGTGHEILENKCNHGDKCPFAHSNEEIMYHPLFYKRHLCKQYQETNACSQYFCPFVHSLAEVRALQHYTLPYTQNLGSGVNIPHVEGVTLTESVSRSTPLPITHRPTKDVTPIASAHPSHTTHTPLAESPRDDPNGCRTVAEAMLPQWMARLSTNEAGGGGGYGSYGSGGGGSEMPKVGAAEMGMGMGLSGGGELQPFQQPMQQPIQQFQQQQQQQQGVGSSLFSSGFQPFGAGQEGSNVNMGMGMGMGMEAGGGGGGMAMMANGIASGGGMAAGEDAVFKERRIQLENQLKDQAQRYSVMLQEFHRNHLTKKERLTNEVQSCQDSYASLQTSTQQLEEAAQQSPSDGAVAEGLMSQFAGKGYCEAMLDLDDPSAVAMVASSISHELQRLSKLQAAIYDREAELMIEEERRQVAVKLLELQTQQQQQQQQPPPPQQAGPAPPTAAEDTQQKPSSESHEAAAGGGGGDHDGGAGVTGDSSSSTSKAVDEEQSMVPGGLGLGLESWPPLSSGTAKKD
ncbi:unnamed protein product [Vitrella brassicaformis CCMP3155]|uniref:C3H1-type domain-containing protein n=2 Tax=Vitrella brassicaformis TaxID=1169539 RepID=A0A0G4F0I8_VITBC|nr:unnamed protein product [Vitrella brassicaformis CCMP3155]|eukprot:CEM04570.1 unnamed protein product [Vitrella brassicaformis CCMP3155]